MGSVYQGVKLPDQALINEISQRIYAPGGPRSIRYYLLSKGSDPATTIHYVGRHADVSRLLRDDANALSLSHYDTLMQAVPGGLSFMVGEHDGQKERWQMLGAALHIAPEIRRTDTQVIESIANAAAENLIAKLKSRPEGLFNAVKEYGFCVPYLVASDLTGLRPPRHIFFSLRLMTWLRNRKDSWGKKRAQSDKIKLQGDMHGAMQYLMWAHLIFGHSFQNYGLRDPVLRMAASFAAKRFMKQTRQCFRENLADKPSHPGGLSLISRFHTIRPDFVDTGRMSPAEFDRNATSLLVEIMGSMQLLIGISFANILSTLIEKDISLLRAADYLSGPDAECFLDEVMRLSPTTPSLYRTALRPDADLQIAKGDVICCLTAAAGMDADVFPKADMLVCPYAHNPKPRRRRPDYLNFGPNEIEPYDLLPDGTRSLDPGVAHPCFGQHWARTIIKIMLLRLAAEDRDGGLVLAETPFTGVEDFLNIPDSLMMQFVDSQHMSERNSTG